MITKQILEKAKSFLEKGWTRCAYARSENLLNVAPDSPQAVCWCALGAIEAAYLILDVRISYKFKAANLLAEAINLGREYKATIPSWNDCICSSKEEMLHTFDKAIELASKI